MWLAPYISINKWYGVYFASCSFKLTFFQIPNYMLVDTTAIINVVTDHPLWILYLMWIWAICLGRLENCATMDYLLEQGFYQVRVTNICGFKFLRNIHSSDDGMHMAVVGEYSGTLLRTETDTKILTELPFVVPNGYKIDEFLFSKNCHIVLTPSRNVRVLRCHQFSDIQFATQH